jgi:hypothetical protein
MVPAPDQGRAILPKPFGAVKHETGMFQNKGNFFSPFNGILG